MRFNFLMYFFVSAYSALALDCTQAPQWSSSLSYQNISSGSTTYLYDGTLGAIVQWSESYWSTRGADVGQEPSLANGNVWSNADEQCNSTISSSSMSSSSMSSISGANNITPFQIVTSAGHSSNRNFQNAEIIKLDKSSNFGGASTNDRTLLLTTDKMSLLSSTPYQNFFEVTPSKLVIGTQASPYITSITGAGIFSTLIQSRSFTGTRIQVYSGLYSTIESKTIKSTDNVTGIIGNVATISRITGVDITATSSMNSPKANFPDLVSDKIVSKNISSEQLSANEVTAISFVSTPKWKIPDYVFEAEYKLRSLPETEAFVKKHKHLPEIPSAKEIGSTGMDLSQMNILLLKKVEELTLHTIELDKKLKKQELLLRKIKKSSK